VEREAFLARLRARRMEGGGSRQAVPAAAERNAASTPGAAPATATAPAPTDLIKLFVARLTARGATVVGAPPRPAARAALARRGGVRGWLHVAAASGLSWPSSALHWTTEAREAQLGLCEADWAVAETGAVVVCSSVEVRRGFSLVPPVVAFFVPVTRIVAALGDVLRTLSGDGPELPSAVTLISGPSGTSDIAGTHVVGVHGPGEVFVWALAGE